MNLRKYFVQTPHRMYQEIPCGVILCAKKAPLAAYAFCGGNCGGLRRSFDFGSARCGRAHNNGHRGNCIGRGGCCRDFGGELCLRAGCGQTSAKRRAENRRALRDFVHHSACCDFADIRAYGRSFADSKVRALHHFRNGRRRFGRKLRQRVNRFIKPFVAYSEH